MNSKQLAVAQTVTKTEWIKHKTQACIAGALSFSMDQIGNTVFIHGSNTDTTSWFEKQFIVQIFIGPRGGVKVKVC